MSIIRAAYVLQADIECIINDIGRAGQKVIDFRTYAVSAQFGK
mgnify:CR=1 FL=1